MRWLRSPVAKQIVKVTPSARPKSAAMRGE